MVTTVDIIAQARSWKGTPWRHQGRLKGIACDCVGLVVSGGIALGLLPADIEMPGYSRYPDPREMIRQLDLHLDRVKIGEQRGGDVLLLKPTRLPQHLAILTFEGTIIHAIDKERGVSEHRLDEVWTKAIAAVYRYRGVTGD